MARRFVAPMSTADAEAKKKAVAREIALKPPTVDFVSSSAGSEVVYDMSGLESLVGNLDKLSDAFKDVAGYEVEVVLAEIVAEAKEQVPYLSGNLSDSIDYDRYQPTTTQKIVEMSAWVGAPNPTRFGASALRSDAGVRAALQSGANKVEVDPAEYARRQHEDLTLDHSKNGGKAKFLEDPFLDIGPTVVNRIEVAFAELILDGREP